MARCCSTRNEKLNPNGENTTSIAISSLYLESSVQTLIVLSIKSIFAKINGLTFKQGKSLIFLGNFVQHWTHLKFENSFKYLLEIIYCLLLLNHLPWFLNGSNDEKLSRECLVLFWRHWACNKLSLVPDNAQPLCIITSSKPHYPPIIVVSYLFFTATYCS